MGCMKLMAAVAGCVAMMVSAAGAQAPGGGCECVVAPNGASTNIGVVSDASGNVMATTAQGFRAVAAGETLTGVSEVMTGPGSSALLSVARTCQVGLAANQSASLSVGGNGNICVARSNVQAQVEQPGDGQVGPGNGLGGVGGLVAITGGVGAAFATVIVGIGTDSASP